MEPSSAWATVITITELCHTATHAIREYAVKMKASAHHGPDQRYGEMVVQVDGLKKALVDIDSLINDENARGYTGKGQAIGTLILGHPKVWVDMDGYCDLDPDNPRVKDRLKSVLLKLQAVLSNMRIILESLGEQDREGVLLKLQNVLSILRVATESLGEQHRESDRSTLSMIRQASYTLDQIFGRDIRTSSTRNPQSNQNQFPTPSFGPNDLESDQEGNGGVQQVQTWACDWRLGAWGYRDPQACFIGQERPSGRFHPLVTSWHRTLSKSSYLLAVVIAGPISQWLLLKSLQLECLTPFDEMVLRSPRSLESLIRAASYHRPSAIVLLCLSVSLNVIAIGGTIARVNNKERSIALMCCWALIISGPLARSYLGYSIIEYFLVFMPFFLGFGVWTGVLAYRFWVVIHQQWKKHRHWYKKKEGSWSFWHFVSNGHSQEPCEQHLLVSQDFLEEKMEV